MIMETPGISPSEPVSSQPISSQYLSPEFTTVNGKGIWNSWTRNFKTPLLALLDLIDNALDSALAPDFPMGRVHVERADDDCYADTDGEDFSGLCITNNSHKPIRPLEKVLEVYNSTKGKGKDTVGENGVGLKQGCATLSDLSFVLTRNRNEMELGVIAACLQRDEGCRLPSFKISLEGVGISDFDERIYEEIEAITECDSGVADCVRTYGNGDIERGIQKLTNNMAELTNHQWGLHSFRLIMVDLRHGSGVTVKSTRSKDRAVTLMQMLRDELPRTYIHVPNSFIFLVDGRKVVFSYWSRRLVELSKFEVMIDTERAFNSYEKGVENWKYPEIGYKIKFFIGFDPIRLRNESEGSHCSLFVYSRQSGRLIKNTPDARALLRLCSGGSDFSQGLTLIVDDEDGKLPLNPTKQDISFGEEQNGAVHETNLYAWMNAVANFYWKLHCRKFNNKKAPMADEVLRHLDSVLMERDRKFKSLLKDEDLTTYYDINWLNFRGNILVHKKTPSPYKVHVGEATKFRIEGPIEPMKTKRTPRKKASKDDELYEKIAVERGERERLERINAELLESLRIEQAEKKHLKRKVKEMQKELEEIQREVFGLRGHEIIQVKEEETDDMATSISMGSSREHINHDALAPSLMKPIQVQSQSPVLDISGEVGRSISLQLGESVSHHMSRDDISSSISDSSIHKRSTNDVEGPRKRRKGDDSAGCELLYI